MRDPQVEYETSDCVSYSTPASWSSTISSVLPPADNEEIDISRQVFLVKGVKKSGKSTFARALLNNLTTRYAIVILL